MPENIQQQINTPEFYQKRLRQLSALAEMNKEIHSTMNINELLQILVEKAIIGVNFERGLIYLVNNDFLQCVAFLDRVKRERGSTIKDWVGFRMDETAVEVMSVKSAKPMYVRDARNDDRISQKFLKITDSKEYCVVPLTGRDSVIGVLTGDKFYSEKRILPEDIETLELFAGHISLAIENARLYEEKEKFNRLLEEKVNERTSALKISNSRLSSKMKELSTLFDMSNLLSENLNLESLLEQMLQLVQDLGYKQCAIHLLEKETLGRTYARGLDKQYQDSITPTLERIINEHLSEKTDPLLFRDIQSMINFSPLKDYLDERGISAGIFVPLRSKERLVAVLAAYCHFSDFFTDEQIRYFSAFAKQAGIALEKAIMFQDIMKQRDRMESLSNRLEQENISLREKLKSELSQKFITGNSPSMNSVMDLIRKVVPTPAIVIIYGETGTGKELIANAIHDMSPRKDGPLIKVNCAAIPEDLLESELFGHEKGAFTGATERRIGMFQLAHKGTIFLDEIGDLSLRTQAKLLRVLQEQEIQPLGAKSSVKVDVRVIAATHQDLRKKIENETFRPDLYYRLNVFPITLPPLRERKEDIPELVDFFMNKYSHLRADKCILNQEIIDIFYNYSWPGNIRELENVIERLMIISQGNTVSKNDLPPELTKTYSPELTEKPLKQAIENFKKDMVVQALTRAGGKKSKAAESLGLPRSNFSRLMKQLGIN